MVLFQKSSVHVLKREIKSPEIAFVLIDRAFPRVVNDPQLHPMGVRRLDSGQIEEPKTDGLEHALLTAILRVALLNAAAEAEFFRLRRVFSTEVIARLKMV